MPKQFSLTLLLEEIEMGNGIDEIEKDKARVVFIKNSIVFKTMFFTFQE